MSVTVVRHITHSRVNTSNCLHVKKEKLTLEKPMCLNNVSVCRWYQATKSNNQAMAAKVDSLKDEMDEALNKVEICKVDLVLDSCIPARASSSG